MSCFHQSSTDQGHCSTHGCCYLQINPNNIQSTNYSNINLSMCRWVVFPNKVTLWWVWEHLDLEKIFKDRKQQLNTCGGVTSKDGKWAFGSNSECLSTNTTHIPQLEPHKYLLMNFHCSPLDLKDTICGLLCCCTCDHPHTQVHPGVTTEVLTRHTVQSTIKELKISPQRVPLDDLKVAEHIQTLNREHILLTSCMQITWIVENQKCRAEELH